MIKKKPEPKGWATEEQWDFLVANCPDFHVAQAAWGKKDTLDTFWKKILKLFLEQFLIEQESKEVLNFWCTISFPHLSAAHLKQWYNNHGNKDHLAPTAIKSVLPKSDTRHLKPVELYSHLYYPTRLKSIIAAKIEEDAIPKPQVLNCIRTMTQEAWDSETEEIRNEVMKLWKAQSNAYKDAKVQITKFIQVLGEATGGCISVLFSICDPNAGSKVWTHGYHLGKDPEGNSFVMANPNYTDKILKLFTSFVKKVISLEVREARALKKRIEEDEEDNEAGVSSIAPLLPVTKSPAPGPQPEPPIQPPPSLPVPPFSTPIPQPEPPVPQSPIPVPQPEPPIQPLPSPPGPQPEQAKSPAPGLQPQPVNVNIRQTDIEDPERSDMRGEDGSAMNDTDDTATHGDAYLNNESVVMPANAKVTCRKHPISEIETMASTWEKRSQFAPAAQEALTIAELVARQSGKGDKTVNGAANGKPKKVSKKAAK